MKISNAEAMLFRGPGKELLSTEYPFPHLNKKEVLVRNILSTICASDVHTYTGKRPGHTPGILGHEIIGEVIALGEDVLDYNGNPIKIGDRITWSVYAYDQNSEEAKNGFPQKSKGLIKYGHEAVTENHHLSGGFATHTHLLEGTALFRLPTHLSNETCAPINCTHATVAGAIRLAGEIENKNVLVSGLGMLGLSAAAMSNHYGAKAVIGIDNKDNRLVHSKKFGVSHSFHAYEDPAELEKKIGNLGGVDIFIDTSGAPNAMELGLSLLNIGGTAIFVGAVYNQRNLEINAEQVVRKLLTIKGLHNYTPEDLDTAIEFISKTENQFPYHELVGKSYLLPELEHALNDSQGGEYYRVAIKP